ncbi:NrsF family protein (plasmid) [Aliirhizobium terrae]|uniref:NrsF family protein n=1 Tax=Terrirhizobium terrae TaxID=2926709 RepID=UPI0025774B40|nr:NrsF family protein [Rhizobium sp. CC-CFT758]WJH38802.1 NrsF family protein [Rhizobium sp. CC-CFT758]
MKTDDLIDMLAQDAPIRVRLGRILAGGALVGGMFSVVILAAAIGIRPHMWEALHSIRVAFKITVTILIFVFTYRLVAQIGKPGIKLKPYLLMLLIPLCLVIAGVAIELVVLPADLWRQNLVGRYASGCLVSIPILSLAPMLFFFWALRQGAPDHAGFAGASAGLAAGGLGAAIYAWHCPDDSPLFMATWYLLAIAAVTISGYLAGRRWLVW